MAQLDGESTMLEKLGALKDAATVERVFGEPQTMGDRMVIPVAEVRTGMGFAIGQGKHKTAGDGEGGNEGGGGGGGGVMARPVGVVEVTPEGTCFIPIKTPVPMFALVLVGVGLGVLLGSIGAKGSLPRLGGGDSHHI
ncbi:MAG: spore germination protein GerW family protein [Armatimonadia bacterium]